MSKTDKTNPWWHDRPWVAEHNIRCVNYFPFRRGYMMRQWITRDRPCDLPPEPPRRKPTPPRYPRSASCNWWPDAPSYYSRAGVRFWPRRPYCSQQSRLMEAGARAAWRVKRNELLATPREYIEDVDVVNPNHRHYAVWDCW